jgi:hypothetical protein
MKNASFYVFGGHDSFYVFGGCRGRDRMVVVQSVPITTNIMSLNRVHDEEYSMQHYGTDCTTTIRSRPRQPPNT